MKEKRYFCDYWFGSKTIKGANALMILCMIVLFLIGTTISYNIISAKYGYELDGYSESAYQRLDEIANDVISEGQGLNLLAIPNDVARYEIIRENDIITFKYTLDNDQDLQFSFPASMAIELSENFEIVSKKPNYSSESEYVKSIKFDMIVISFAFGGLSSALLVLTIMIVATIAAFISLIHKKRRASLTNNKNGA